MNLHLLGTGAPFADVDRAPTMLAFHTHGRAVAVDCGGDLARALHRAGIPHGDVAALIVTHEHPDHTAGFPVFLLKLWLARRTAPLVVAGNADAIAQVQRTWAAYHTDKWDLFPVEWRVVPCEPGVLLFEDDVFRITGAPGVHPANTLGVRVEAKPSGRICAYSCDTEPTPPIVDLARGAHLLVHEATGQGPGHSSAAQAAEVAAQAGVARLALVHLPAVIPPDDLAAARALVGDVTVGEDGLVLPV